MDENEEKKKTGYELGQDIYDLSVEDIGEAIELLQEEVRRLEAARAEKSSHLAAAEALFGKKS